MDVLAVLGSALGGLPVVQIAALVETPYGPEYGPPVAVSAYVEAKRRLVLDLDGGEVLSETTVFAPVGTVAASGDRVTLPSGVTTTVIRVATYEGAPLPEHVEITCQ